MISDTTLSILSWRQHEVLERTLSTFEKRGVLGEFSHRRIFFNELSPGDLDIARTYGLEAIFSKANLGIFGGARALAQACTTEFMLFVENDCWPIVDKTAFVDGLARAIADMTEYDCPVFSLRSRRQPGEKFDRRERYSRYFRIEQPLDLPAQNPANTSRKPTNSPLRVFEDLRKPKLRGCALYAEERPDLRHPSVIRKTKNGNWLTTSRFLNWSNNCLLIRTRFMCETIINRVESHPAATTINGQQNIEGAVKLNGWWATQNVPMGQAEPGPMTHVRRI